MCLDAGTVTGCIYRAKALVTPTRIHIDLRKRMPIASNHDRSRQCPFTTLINPGADITFRLPLRF